MNQQKTYMYLLNVCTVRPVLTKAITNCSNKRIVIIFLRGKLHWSSKDYFA